MLLLTMEEITMEVIGRPAADGRNQIKPALVKTYNDQAGEIKNIGAPSGPTRRSCTRRSSRG